MVFRGEEFSGDYFHSEKCGSFAGRHPSDLELPSLLFIAVMLVMFNKSALSSYKFPCANVITVLQVLSRKKGWSLAKKIAARFGI